MSVSDFEWRSSYALVQLLRCIALGEVHWEDAHFSDCGDKLLCSRILGCCYITGFIHSLIIAEQHRVCRPTGLETYLLARVSHACIEIRALTNIYCYVSLLRWARITCNCLCLWFASKVSICDFLVLVTWLIRAYLLCDSSFDIDSFEWYLK